MYVSGRSNGKRRDGMGKDIGNRENGQEIFSVPSDYSGNAFRDPAALSIAEEAFRRGYVFGENNAEVQSDLSEQEPENSASTDSIPIEVSGLFGMPTEENASQNEPSVAASATPIVSKESGEGLFSGLLRGITAEHIILVAAILILWDSRADDELLIMLAILLFC